MLQFQSLKLILRKEIQMFNVHNQLQRQSQNELITAYAKTLVYKYGLTVFGRNNKEKATLTTSSGDFELQCSPKGGYFINLTYNDVTYRSYTHPTRSLNIKRLSYDIQKLIRAHHGDTNVSQVVKV